MDTLGKLRHVVQMTSSLRKVTGRGRLGLAPDEDMASLEGSSSFKHLGNWMQESEQRQTNEKKTEQTQKTMVLVLFG